MRSNLPRIIAGGLLAFGAASSLHAATLTLSCGSNAADIQFCEPYAKEWGKQHGHEIKLFTPPASTTDYLALLRQQFAAKSGDIDVINIDVVWPGVI